MAKLARYGNPANYNLSPQTRDDGDASALEIDEIGNLKIKVDRDPASTARSTATTVLPTQPVNSSGNVITPISVYSKANFTRPADVTAYAAGDAVTDSTTTPTIITFSNCARSNAGSGKIVNVLMQDSANVSTKGSFELWLFHTTVTPDNDNAVFTPTDAENRTLIGIVPFTLAYVGDATAGAGGNAVYMGTVDRPLPFVCDAGTTSLYGLVVVRNAYIPVSAERFDFNLLIEQN